MSYAEHWMGFSATATKAINYISVGESSFAAYELLLMFDFRNRKQRSCSLLHFEPIQHDALYFLARGVSVRPLRDSCKGKFRLEKSL